MSKIIHRRFILLFVFLIALTILTGCSPASNTSNSAKVPVMDPVVIDAQKWLADGESASWKLEPGSYKLEMTASGDGARAEWVGSDCPETRSSEHLTMTCEMPRTGQLIIKNHAVIGAGDPVSVTVKVTK